MTPQETIERALAVSKADGCVVIVSETSETNLRWANNTLTTNGAMRTRSITVISVVAGATGTAAGVVARSTADASAIEDLVRAAEAAARAKGADEDAMPLVDAGDQAGDWDRPPTATSMAVLGDFSPHWAPSWVPARPVAACSASPSTR